MPAAKETQLYQAIFPFDICVLLFVANACLL